MVRKVGNNHYVATAAVAADWADGADSQRTDATNSNGYFVHNHAPPHELSGWEDSSRGRTLEPLHGRRGYSPSSARSARSHNSARTSHRDDRDDIYITSQAYHHPPSYTSRSYRGGSAGAAPLVPLSTRSTVSRKGGVVVETMSAPNPFCPNTRGCCCLLLLINLAIILITLGFVVVLQFFEPVFVWVLGIIFLIFGFIALGVSMVYCVSVCKDAKTPRQVAQEDHYWTRHWQKNFALPEIHYQGEKSRPPSASPQPYHHRY